MQLLSYRLRFNVKGKRSLSFTQSFKTLQLSQNHHFLILRNLMAKHISTTLGSPQSRQRYVSMAKQQATQLRNSTMSTSISSCTSRQWFSLSSHKQKNIPLTITIQFLTNLHKYTTIQIRYRRRKISYQACAKALIHYMLTWPSLNVFCTKHKVKTGQTSIKSPPFETASIPQFAPSSHNN